MPKIDIGSDDDTPIYLRIIEALSRDIASGHLAGGDALPPHRNLAKALGVSPGTITRAYREAEMHGLIEGHVGRGTRVNAHAAPVGRESKTGVAMPRSEEVRNRNFAMLNLALNEPPIVQSLYRLADVFAGLGNEPDGWLDFCSYAPSAGFEAQRVSFSRWMTSQGLQADPQRTALCKGAQHAIDLVFSVCTARGDSVLVESFTYSGVRSVAVQNDLRLFPVHMDDEGILPEALAEAAQRTGARVAYLVPTLQNPTTSVMSLKRREEIIEIARRLDLILVEDDVYGALVPEAPPPLAALAPDICFYISSLSKTVCPALRTGYVLAPNDRLFSAISRRIQSTMLTATSLDTIIASRLIETGAAQSIIDEVRTESQRRTRAAQELLGPDVALKCRDGGFHIWLPMNSEKAEQVVSAAVMNGIAITPPSSIEVSGDGQSGLRLCLGAPNFEDLAAGLNSLRPLLIST
ncbi:PLP-dependent aminotransferase family protein [Allorhizobium ampelinum]|uniref:aminotransferase-like domain-containing protein n=1 Tax=Allorhizobium ampelinum TaxID=3025782 RepID=UPI001F42721A|nr:PLP-dependent aminotransferase family protein [Allorhizobium ampelinum]